MGPVVVNGSHTAHKQHQRICVRICVRVASRVLCELGPGGGGNDDNTYLVDSEIYPGVRDDADQVGQVALVQGPCALPLVDLYCAVQHALVLAGFTHCETSLHHLKYDRISGVRPNSHRMRDATRNAMQANGTC